MSAALFHVVARDNQWRVEREGGVFSVSFDTLDQAIRAAQKRARIAEPAVVVVHDGAGQVREERKFDGGEARRDDDLRRSEDRGTARRSDDPSRAEARSAACG